MKELSMLMIFTIINIGIPGLSHFEKEKLSEDIFVESRLKPFTSNSVFHQGVGFEQVESHLGRMGHKI